MSAPCSVSAAPIAAVHTRYAAAGCADTVELPTLGPGGPYSRRQTFALCDRRHLGARLGAELAENRVHVVLDRAHRTEQPLGDLGILQPKAQQLEDLPLARGESPGVALSGGPGATGNPAHAGLAQTLAQRFRRRLRAEPLEDRQRFQLRLIAAMAERPRLLVRAFEAGPHLRRCAPFPRHLQRIGLGTLGG